MRCSTCHLKLDTYVEASSVIMSGQTHSGTNQARLNSCLGLSYGFFTRYVVPAYTVICQQEHRWPYAHPACDIRLTYPFSGNAAVGAALITVVRIVQLQHHPGQIVHQLDSQTTFVRVMQNNSHMLMTAFWLIVLFHLFPRHKTAALLQYGNVASKLLL